MPEMSRFAAAAGDPDTTLDVLALALAAEFRDVDIAGAIARLDVLGAEVARAAAEQTHATPQAQALACAQTIGVAHGFVGDREHYDDPDNSMLDLVLTRRRGLPILLSVVYVEAARRAAIPIVGVGLPGIVVGHFGTDPPVLLDPFAGGGPVATDAPRDVVRPWRADEIAMRMLNNLVAAYGRRGDVGAAIHAAGLRLALPAGASQRDALQAELRAIQARLN